MPRPARPRAARPGRARAGCRAARRPRPGVAARLEHGPRLVGVERALLAERRRSSARTARHASSISPHTSSTYSSGRPSYSAGTACAPRNVDVVGELGRDRAPSARSASGVQPVARLDLEVRDAGPHAPRRGGRARQRAQLVRRWRRGWPPVVTLIPHAAYGRPAIRAANSSARSPANTRCVWLSTNPGSHAAAGGVDALVAGRPGSLDRGRPRSSSITTRGVARRARAAPRRARARS